MSITEQEKRAAHARRVHDNLIRGYTHREAKYWANKHDEIMQRLADNAPALAAYRARYAR